MAAITLTERQININFQEAMRKAERLEGIAEDIRKIAVNEMENEIRNISGNWKGENATEYLKKVEIVRGKMEKTASNLKQIAQTIRTIARNTYDAEMSAIRIAKIQGTIG